MRIITSCSQLFPDARLALSVPDVFDFHVPLLFVDVRPYSLQYVVTEQGT